MYQGWVTHTHTHLGGQCPHLCKYCYVDNPRFGRPLRYQGPIRPIMQEFNVKYGSDKTVFIENCNDLFAEAIPATFIHMILAHCAQWPDNTYVFQTKNPARYQSFLEFIPHDSILGTTIETNRDTSAISNAPQPIVRYQAMILLETRKFVTIEPVLDFDVVTLAKWILLINPQFVNIGADSKDHGLPEPSIEKVDQLIAFLKTNGIEIREKHNLNRLRQ